MTSLDPAVEAKRLAAVAHVLSADPSADAALDDITAMAAQLCNAPMAILSLLGRDELASLSCFGLPRIARPRANALCTEAAAQCGVFIVPDATLDARFAGNRFVTGAPGVRFYAGVALRSEDGLVLGTLCVVDTVTRHSFSGEAKSHLERLARLAEVRLSAHALRGRACDAEARVQAVTRDAAGAFVACDRILTNLEGRVRAGLTRLERAAERGRDVTVEAALLREIIDELAMATRLDCAGAREPELIEPGALLCAVVADRMLGAAAREISIVVRDHAQDTRMLGDAWRLEELFESVLDDCVAAARGLVRISCQIEAAAAGANRWVLRIAGEEPGASAWRLSARSRRLIDVSGGGWRVSSETRHMSLWLPARLWTARTS